MVDFLITPASGTAAISDSSGVSTTPGANKLWASGTNLYWGTTQVDGGGGDIGGNVSAGYIPYASSADTLADFAKVYKEDKNLIIGSTPASIHATDADKNTGFGADAANGITDGDENVMIGYRAGKATTTGGYNTFVGAGAGLEVTGASYNNFFGYLAGYSGATRGNQNNAFGYYAMSIQAGTNNVAMGHNAMQGEAGADNDESVGIGAYALRNISGTADMNTAVGYATMQGAGTGLTDAAQYNTAVGNRAMSGLTSGYSNVAMGRDTLTSITSGYDNTVIGTQAGGTLTTGYYNTYIGKVAGSGATTSAHSNVAVGFDALTSNHGARNVAIGRGALRTTTDANQVAVGYLTLAANTTGEKNTAVGYEALTTNTTGNYNTAMGHQALASNVHGDYNTAFGYKALVAAATGDGEGGNTAIGGYMTLGSVTAGIRNNAMGHSAGHSLTTGNYNDYIGYQSGYANVHGDYNVGLGRSTLYYNAPGDGNGRNVAIGSWAMYGAAANATTGSTAVGYAAMYYTTGNNNIAIGHGALEGDSTTNSSYSNTAVGFQALKSATTAYEITAIGHYAGYNVTTANRNTYIGHQAGYNQAASAEYGTMIGMMAGYDVSGQRNTIVGGGAGANAAAAMNESTYIGTYAGGNCSGNQATFVGYSAGISTNTATGLTALGTNALRTITGNNNTALGWGTMADGAGDAGANVAVGYRTLQAITTGDRNVSVGNWGLSQLQTHNDNVTMGDEAGKQIYSSNNTIIGSRAGEKLDGDTNGSGHNTIVGAWAGRGDSNLFYGGYNVIVGAYAMNSNSLSSARNNVVLGHKAASGSTSMVDNVVIGDKAGMSMTTASYNTFIGHEAGYDVTTADESVYIGYNSGRVNNAAFNVFIGNGAGETATGVGSSVFIGRQAAGAAAATGDDNVGIGYRSMYDLTTGYNNAALGHFSLPNITTGYENVAVGRNSLNSNAVSSRNTALGANALQAFTETGEMGNVGVGYGSMYNVQTGSSNVAIGYYALKGNNGVDSDYNVAIGAAALNNDNGGDKNVAIGYKAGFSNTTGTGNVFIGHLAASGATATDSNKLYIHNDSGTPLIGGDFSAGKVGINTDSPAYELDLNGTFYWDGNHWRGADTNGPSMRNETPSSTNPVWTFNNDVDTGMSRAAANELSLITAATEAIRIDSSQNVGIGTTAPSNALTVHKAISNDFVTELKNTHATAGQSWGLQVCAGTNSSDAALVVENEAEDTSLFYVRGDGKIGIGTNAPSEKFDVRSGGSNTVALFKSDDNRGLIQVADDDTTISLVAEGTKASIGTVGALSATNLNIDNTGKVGIGTVAPEAKLHIVGSADAAGGIRLNNGTYNADIYQDSGHNLIIDPYNDFIVTGADDIKFQCGDDIEFYNAGGVGFISGSQSMLNLRYDGGGVTNYRGTVGKIEHNATPIAQVKDDTGFLMEDAVGIRNSVSTISEWMADLAGTTLEGNVVGYGKVQVIKTDTIDPTQLGAATGLKLYLPAAVTGMEYIVTYGTEQSNLSGKAFSVDANGSELIYKGGTEGAVAFSKNTGESLHVSCFETGKWSVVAHT